MGELCGWTVVRESAALHFSKTFFSVARGSGPGSQISYTCLHSHGMNTSSG